MCWSEIGLVHGTAYGETVGWFQFDLHGLSFIAALSKKLWKERRHPVTSSSRGFSLSMKGGGKALTHLPSCFAQKNPKTIWSICGSPRNKSLLQQATKVVAQMNLILPGLFCWELSEDTTLMKRHGIVSPTSHLFRDLSWQEGKW